VELTKYLETTAINEFYATLFGKNVNQAINGGKICEWAEIYANKEQPIK